MRSLILALIMAIGATGAQAQEKNQVFKSESCQCCNKWIKHMSDAGIALDAKDIPNSERTRMRVHFGIRSEWAACHTAIIGGYLIEGHVPAEDVKRLLEEKPDAMGLTVPGMPKGSPGMEQEDGSKEPYDVLLMKKDGTTEVFAKH
ncbi:MAG: DUF411 domain-containing protein [Hyphomicrobium sp.]